MDTPMPFELLRKAEVTTVWHQTPFLPASVRTTPVFDTFWRFASMRQELLFRRLARIPAPWTSDPILARHKFTNVFRASDRVSQYLIRNVIYSGEQSPEESFFRIILFKLFNRTETWEILLQELGQITWS